MYRTNLTGDRVAEFEDIFDRLLQLSIKTPRPETEFLFALAAMATGFIYASYEETTREEIFNSYIDLVKDVWEKRHELENEGTIQ